MTRAHLPAWVAALGVAVVTTAVLAPAVALPFVSFDDGEYVTGNAVVRGGLTGAGLQWALLTNHASNWHPLTWLSHMLDVQLFGVDPRGHHGVSVLLHGATAATLFLAWHRMTGERARSLAVALLFAVHPLRVESVAWVAERKDVLAGLLGALTLLLHARHAARPSPARLAATTATFALGLMAKPMLVTLPFALLLVDAWPLDRAARAGWPRLVAEKAPMLAASVASSIVTVHAQSWARDESLPFGARLAGAAAAYAAYLARTLVPTDLASFYPREAPSLAAAGGGVALVVALTALAAWTRARRPWIAVGWCWFAGMLVPTLGLVTVGAAATADRYTYLPSVGLFVAAVWTAADAARARAWLRPALPWALAAALVAAALATRRQLRFFSSDLALWQRARDVGGESPTVELGLALAHATEAHDREASARHCRNVARLAPRHAFFLRTCGEHLLRLGFDDDALAALRAAARAAPSDGLVLYDLGVVLARRGDAAGALDALTRAVAAAPGEDAPRAALARLHAVVDHAIPAPPAPHPSR